MFTFYITISLTVDTQMKVFMMEGVKNLNLLKIKEVKRAVSILLF